MHFISLGKLIVMILFISHFYTCIWIDLEKWESYFNRDVLTWRNKYNNSKASLYDFTDYVNGYYFMTVTSIDLIF
jgi:hypothetical protein